MNAQQLAQAQLLVDVFPKVLKDVHLLAMAADLYSSHEESDHEVVDRYERLHLARDGVEAILTALAHEFKLVDPEIDDRHREVK
jgi:hypothetical protein